MVTEQTGIPAEDTAEAAAAVLSEPAQLVAARQAAGLSASEVAGRLGMATRQIEALERGDWQALPGQAFVRGALRAYGKTVGVDVSGLLAGLGGQVAAPALRQSTSLEPSISRGGFAGGAGGVGGRLAWIVFGIAAVIAIVFYFGRNFELGSDEAVSESLALRANGAASTDDAAGTGSPGLAMRDVPAAQDTASQAGSDAGGPGGGIGTDIGGGAASGAAAGMGAGAASGGESLTPLTPLMPLVPAAGGTASAEAAPAGTEAGGAGSIAGAPGVAGTAGGSPGAGTGDGRASAPTSTSSTLKLSFERESWVEIRDAAGKVLLTGTQPAGSERQLSGERPLSLVIGNASYVRLERDGQAVDLAARARNGVARLRLD